MDKLQEIYRIHTQMNMCEGSINGIKNSLEELANEASLLEENNEEVAEIEIKHQNIENKYNTLNCLLSVFITKRNELQSELKDISIVMNHTHIN